MSMADRIAVLDGGRVVQVATPVELYRNPANAFVADFIGTSTLLHGRLQGGQLHLPGGVEVPCALSGPDSGEVKVMLRPEDITVDSSGKISGTVVSTNFYGPNCLVVAECSIGAPVKYLVSNNEVPEVGSPTTLRWAKDAGVVVRAD